MEKKSEKKKRPDFSEIALRVVETATKDKTESTKNSPPLKRRKHNKAR